MPKTITGDGDRIGRFTLLVVTFATAKERTYAYALKKRSSSPIPNSHGLRGIDTSPYSCMAQK